MTRWPRVLAWFLAVLTLAVAGEVGTPSIRSYPAREYAASHQNWAIVQDSRGIIYVGNNEGVLEFDGVRWRLIGTPNHSPVRSLAVDAQGRIYVGAVGEIGYLAATAQGRMAYVSLTDRIGRDMVNFNDVWKIHPTARGVYFFTSDSIFLLSPDGFHAWQTESPFHLGFGVGNRFFVQQMDVGLMELDGERLEPIPCGDFFKRDKIYFILPWDPASAGRPATLMIGVRGRGLFLYDGQRVTPFPTQADPLLKEHLLYSAALLPNGSLALGTLQGGMVLLSREGRIQLRLDKHTGLPDTTVYALAPDRQGGLWLGLGNGIARLQWPAAFSRFDPGTGLEGNVLALHRHAGQLYAGTSRGLYRLDPRGPDQQPSFTAIAGIRGQTWHLASVGSALLAANYEGLFEIRAGRASLVQASRSTCHVVHPLDPGGDRLLLGMVGGLSVLRRSGAGGWVSEGPVPGIGEAIRSIEDAGEGRLWLGTSGHEVLRVTLAGPLGAPMVERFGPGQGLASHHGIAVRRIAGRVVFCTDQGIFRFEEASRTFTADPRFAGYFSAGPRRMLVVQEDPRGRVWLASLDEASKNRELAVGSAGADGVYQWHHTPFARFSNMDVSAILAEADGISWFGGPELLFRLDPSVTSDASMAFSAHVRAVLAKDGSLRSGDGPGSARITALPARDNALRFEFSATSFDNDWANQYQIRLDGFDNDWSPWSATTFKEYSYLPEGQYVFRVRARNGYDILSQEASWAFTLAPPWHRSWWARLLFLALLISAVAAGHSARTRLLRLRNLTLQRRVADATRELKERERLLASQAEDLAQANEQLRAINEQKNQFIGIVAHDLRNPLNGIMLASELLEEAEPGSTRTARMIRQECRDMDALIGRFLDIAAIEAGTVVPEPVNCALVKVAEKVISRHAQRAAKKSIRIDLDPAANLQPAFVDEHFAKEILDNLLSNALKFSPAGATVTIRLRNQGDRVLLTVEDHGPGLTEQDLTRLFSRFTKLSAIPTGGERSLGLGLSIVKHMVDSMGGKIWVVTTTGQGAAFHVDFPAVTA